MKRIVFTILLLAVFWIVLEASAQAQTPSVTDVDITISVPPEGLSGYVIEGGISEGVLSGDKADINCNGRRDFQDVVELFLNLSDGIFQCPTSTGTVGKITGLTVTDIGLSMESFTDDTFTITAVDLNDSVNSSSTAFAIATVHIETVQPGTGFLHWDSNALDDDNGNPVTEIRGGIVFETH